MVRIPRCGCLTSYKSREKDTYLTRSRLQAWSFLLESCKKGLIVAETVRCCIGVAKQLQKLRSMVFDAVKLQHRCIGCNICRCDRQKRNIRLY